MKQYHDLLKSILAQVTQMIVQGVAQANQTRAQLRPLGFTTRMVFAVSDSAGDVLGLYRMADAPMFSIGVAVSKARNVAYYDDAAQLKPTLQGQRFLNDLQQMFLAD